MFLIAIAPADAHALAMSGVLIFALSSLLTMFFIMARNGQHMLASTSPNCPTSLRKKNQRPRRKHHIPPLTGNAIPTGGSDSGNTKQPHWEH